VTGGYLDGPDGIKVRIKRQEFPFDIGIWSNLVQGMGTSNIIAWFWPFSATPSIEGGLDYETNGFEDPSLGWPPPDPDRIPRLARRFEETSFSRDSDDEITTLREFRKRQKEDMKRWNTTKTRTRSLSNTTGYSLTVPAWSAHNESSDSLNTPTPSPAAHLKRRQPFHQRYDAHDIAANDSSNPNLYVDGEGPGEEAWTNHEGDGLKDFGLDEEAEFYDEEDVPLAELIRRRKAKAKVEE
jgi:palmitoyltransferase